jgi:hypothetical protein
MGTLVCTIEMDKGGGLTVTVDNADDKSTQTIKMNGSMIELKVKGDQATSVITQTAEKVSIQCKQFEVKAEETVSIASDKASEYKSGDTLMIQSAKDLSLESDTKVQCIGQTAVALTGGSQSSLELAASAAKLSGTKIDLSGQAQLSARAPQVEIKSDAMMSLESSGLATLKGSLTNVQGNLINLG